MAKAFLQSHGIDIDEEMSRIQSNTDTTTDLNPPLKSGQRVSCFANVSLPSTPPCSRWDVHINPSGRIEAVSEHSPSKPSQRQSTIQGKGALLAPSLCHPHVHLDKSFLLSHPKYAHLQIRDGDFQEAMKLTGEAKALFTEDDLLERGQRLIDESVTAGVTHMRAFVEVDAGVGMKCLEAGILLKREAEAQGRCRIQLCAFAQLPLFSASQGDEHGGVIRELMQQAARMDEVEALGSTPYVESDRSEMQRNIEWLLELSIQHSKHLDFHLDYNLDPKTEPLVWDVVRVLQERDWAERNGSRKIALGHCTRLVLFSAFEYERLRREIGDLPVSFVGLPTSDLFMMRTADRTRGTLDVPMLINNFDFNACIGINNIGNAFTPHGSCDPLSLACNGVGVYQAGTKDDAELLFECVSTRARAAIGSARVGEHAGKALKIVPGDEADVLLFGAQNEGWATRSSVSEAVYLYDHCNSRKAWLGGRLTT